MAAANNSDDPLIGVTIAGRYRVISQLGVGGMGTAYRAWDEQAGVPVVIKIPNKRFLEDPDFAERFRREIRLLQGLIHPHIVPIVDDGEHEGLVFYVMRFLPGGSLSNRRLRDDGGRVKPNPPGMLHLWLTAVADALDHIHDRGVVHRDVKPANIFFDAGWGAFVGDFGIAKIVAESEVFDREQTLTVTGMGLGTPDYMAPEQFTPKARVDGRADQYALAVIAYEMMAGTRPFTGENANLILEIMTQQARRLDTKRSGLPPSLVEAVSRGLAKQPEGRFATCREFATAVLQDVPPIAEEPGVARLLCPKCANLLKLPESAAGKKGKCPKCQTEMKVADDLGAMWLLDEARRQEDAASVGGFELAEGEAGGDVPSAEAFRPLSGMTPVGPAAKRFRQGTLAWIDGHGLLVGGVLALAASILWILLATSEAAIQRLRAEKRELEKQFIELTKKSNSLQKENESLEKQVNALENEIVKLHSDVDKLQADLAVAQSTWPPLNTAKLNTAKLDTAKLDTAALDAAALDATALGDALAAVADTDNSAYLKLRTSWYRAITRVAEELVAVENASVTSGRPFVSTPDSVNTLHEGIGSQGRLGAELAALAPDWLAYEKRGGDGIVMPVTFGSAHRVGPYWAAKVSLTGTDGRHIDLTVISRREPAAITGDRVIVTGVAMDGTVIWAADVRSTNVDALPPAGKPNPATKDTSEAKPAASLGGDIEAAASAQEILARPPLVNSIGVELKLIPAGTFKMGSNDGEADEKPVHEVRITKPFYLGVTEVTNAQWKAVMGNVPSSWKDDNRPVEQVNWDDAVKFCEKLSALQEEKKSGRVYRLPTEAEWEYACRAGSKKRFSFGDGKGLGDFVWLDVNSQGETHPVGGKKPNPWGLHDMHGNVSEWCNDWDGPYGADAAADPAGPLQGSNHVVRGGSWRRSARCSRSAFRSWSEPSMPYDDVGFRLALSPSVSNPSEASGK